MKSTAPLRLLAAALAAIALANPARAVPDAQFEPAFQQFVQANHGVEAAIEKSVDAFTALLKSEPTNPVLMAYAGAATSMQANTTMLPWKKMSYSEDGLALLDKALAMLTPGHDAALQHGVPGALEVRFVAASTFLGVPGFMNRGARGVKLLGEVMAHPLFNTSPLGFKGNVWLKAATVAAKDKRTDEARKFLNRVIEANAPQADAARAQLAKLAA